MEIPKGQTLKHLRTEICEFRLTDDSQNILVLVEIHPGLSADRSIHLRQQSCRHIGKTHPSLIDAGSKAGHISDYTAPDSQHKSIPVGIVLQKPGTYIHNRFEGLAFLRGLHKPYPSLAVLKHLHHPGNRRTFLSHIPVYDSIYVPVRLQTGIQSLKSLSHYDTAYSLFSGKYVDLLHRGARDNNYILQR